MTQLRSEIAASDFRTFSAAETARATLDSVSKLGSPLVGNPGTDGSTADTPTDLGPEGDVLRSLCLIWSEVAWVVDDETGLTTASGEASSFGLERASATKLALPLT